MLIPSSAWLASSGNRALLRSSRSLGPFALGQGFPGSARVVEVTSGGGGFSAYMPFTLCFGTNRSLARSVGARTSSGTSLKSSL